MATFSAPLVQTEDRNTNQLQQNIIQAVKKSLINMQSNVDDKATSASVSALQTSVAQLTGNALTQGAILTSVSLVVGANTISHGLGRALQGWSIVRMRSSFSQIFDTQDANAAPTTTLLLNSSAAVVVDIYVF